MQAAAILLFFSFLSMAFDPPSLGTQWIALGCCDRSSKFRPFTFWSSGLGIFFARPLAQASSLRFESPIRYTCRQPCTCRLLLICTHSTPLKRSTPFPHFYRRAAKKKKKNHVSISCKVSVISRPALASSPYLGHELNPRTDLEHALCDFTYYFGR